jgi:hypothetical protein
LDSHTRGRAAAWSATAALLVALSLAPGLTGPFVLDDQANLVEVFGWVNGDLPFGEAVFGASGPLGRPIAYFTLMLNAWLGGAAPWGYKALNLGLHLLCAALAATLLHALLRRDGMPDGRARSFALALAVLWALHPMQVSTVLYVVQRMAMLGAIAQLAVLLLYLRGREALARDPARGWRLLLLGVPAALAAGVLAKENAVMAVPLVLLLEFTWFAPQERAGVRGLRAYLALLVLPLVAGAVWLALSRGLLVDAYEGREFDLAQRLLTQPRVLGDYLLSWLLPLDAHLGLYRDGYPASRGWLDPPSALGWTVAGGVLLVASFLLRRRLRWLWFGAAWFCLGHALEGSVLPLEPYFEHRNYLPSLGLAMALLALPALRTAPPRTLFAAVIVLALASAALTAQRAWQWRDVDRLYATEGPPAGEVSRRLQVDRAIRAFETRDRVAEREALAVLAAGGAGNRAAGAAWSAIFACERGEALAAAPRRDLLTTTPTVMTHNHLSWLELLARRVAAGRCPGLAPADLQRLLQRWRDASPPLTGYQRVRLAQVRGALGSAP